MDQERELLSDLDKARMLINAEFGLGAKAAQEKLHSDPTTKRIYDCAVEVLARSIRTHRERAEAASASSAVRQTAAFLGHWRTVAPDQPIAAGLTYGDLRELLELVKRGSG